MTRNEITREYVAAVKGDGGATMETLLDALDVFRVNVANMPTEVQMHPTAYYHLLKTADLGDIATGVLDTIMGMKIVINRELAEGDWRLVKKEINVFAPKGEK